MLPDSVDEGMESETYNYLDPAQGDEGKSGMPEGPNGGAALPFMTGGPAGGPEVSLCSRPEGPGLGPGCPLGSKPARLHSTVRKFATQNLQIPS